MKLLIDCDTLCYSTAIAHETEIRWSDEVHTLHSDSKVCIESIEAKVAKLKKDLDATEVVLVLTDYKDNFRRTLCYPEYKYSRKKIRRPLCLGALREYVIDKYNAIVLPSLEGDDVLGILSTTKSSKDIQKVIVSIDKDLKTIPGWHYNPDKDTELRFISREEADYYFYLQTLMGDRTDGYPGCPGIGPKTAEKILAAAAGDNPWPYIVKAYVKEGLTEDFALSQARCARILRSEDYDLKTNTIKLWRPHDN